MSGVVKDNARVHAFRDDALGEMDATGVAECIAKGEISAAEAVDAAIARIESIDPLLNVVATRDYERARKEAQRPPKGPFGGVPTMIKDDIDVAGLPTRNGSEALQNVAPARKHSAFTRQLLAQGPIILGKSRLPEFGLIPSGEFQNEPAVHNPWNPGFSSGGSSAGSAVLVATGALPLAHGEDGGGSIRIPAACCGVVGLKVTRNRLVNAEVGRFLPVNIVYEGVLTRSVRDTAFFLAEAERYYRNTKLKPVGKVEGPGKRRLRIGMIVDSITEEPTDRETRAAVEKAAELLESLGHRVEHATIPLDEEFISDFLTYYGGLALGIAKLGPVLFGRGFDANRLNDMSKSLAKMGLARLGKLPGAALRLRRSRESYAHFFDDHDVVISPTVGTVPPPLGWLNPGVPYEELIVRVINFMNFTPPNNASGSPAISLPLGHSAGDLPIGIQLAAREGDERTLLELAFELEAAQPWRRIQDRE
ncbi:MAG: amidase [Firmicutes bacterium]|jgi:amidase|nr:amidase [Bacillota bacterium]